MREPDGDAWTCSKCLYRHPQRGPLRRPSRYLVIWPACRPTVDIYRNEFGNVSIGCPRLTSATTLTDLATGGLRNSRSNHQIRNLLNLAPEIQEEILFLPNTMSGRDRISERRMRQIAGVVAWNRQRKMWQILERQLMNDLGGSAEHRDGRPIAS